MHQHKNCEQDLSLKRQKVCGTRRRSLQNRRWREVAAPRLVLDAPKHNLKNALSGQDLVLRLKEKVVQTEW